LAESLLAGLVFDFVFQERLVMLWQRAKTAKTNTSSPPFISVAPGSYEALRSIDAAY
jgi:hypothetical protein